MKLLLLKILLQRRARDEGFTLPMVIALGLVMLLLGAVNIVKSGEENVNSITQSQRTDAFAIAELGAAQYRQFFDRNRSLIVHNRNRWTSIADVCETVSNTTNGWASNELPETAFNAANWRSITLNEVQLGRDLNNDGDAEDTDAAINIGSYKIVDYEYDIDGNLGGTDNDNIENTTDDNGIFNILSDANTDDDPPNLAAGVTANSIIGPSGDPTDVNVNSLIRENDRNDDGQSDARGILTIKGRTPDGSETQIEYEIPVRVNEGDLNNLDPVLWINRSSITDLGNLDIDQIGDRDGDGRIDDTNGDTDEGNLVISHRIGDGNITWDGNDLQPCQNPADLTVNGETISVESDPRGVPSLAGLRRFINNVDLDGDGNEDGLPSTAENALPLNINSTTPRLGSTNANEFNDGIADNDPIFFYEGTAGLNINGDLRTDGISDVVLYVTGDININAPAGNPLNIGFEPTILDYTSPNLQIHSTGSITINTNGETVNITGLIHAPEGTLTINGNGTVNIVGAVWVNDLNNSGGATVNIESDQINTATGFEDSYAYYRVAGDRDPKPITQPPTNWKTEEVD